MMQTECFQSEDQLDDELNNSIDMLERHARNIPPGWQSLYAQCIASLKAVNCVQRSSTIIHAPDATAGLLSILAYRNENMEDADPVVLGILRKAQKRASCTCEICGRSAAGTGAIIWRKLCSLCEMRSEMHDDIARLLRTLSFNPRRLTAGPLVPLATLSIGTREMIPPDMVHTLDTKDKSQHAEYLLLHDLKELKPRFEQVKVVLKRLLDPRS
jgi:hypothetical protein